MARDPADVCGAPVDVVFLQIEHPPGGRIHLGQVAPGRVHHALGLPGRARRVQDEERVLGVHRLGLAPDVDLPQEVMIPEVTTRAHLHPNRVRGLTFPRYNDHVLNRGAAGQGGVTVCL